MGVCVVVVVGVYVVECVVVVVVVVVECVVEVCGRVVGLAVLVGREEVAGDAPPEPPKLQAPWMIPRSCEAKKLNKPLVMSSPP